MPDTDTHGPENSCDDGGTKSSLLHLRHKVYQESYLARTLIDQEPFSVYQGKKRSTKPKRSFLQIVSTEVSINVRLHGQLDVLHSKFHKLTRRLPHYTIYHILSFLGVSEMWLKFFLTFLRPPLRFRPDLGSSKTQLRNRGIPFRFVLSAVFEEVVLFCLDLAVNQATDGGLLYRRPGDQFFWSPSETHVEDAWETIQSFAAVTGVLVEGESTRLGDPKRCSSPYCGSLPPRIIRLDGLYLSPGTGRFEIDENLIYSYVDELQSDLRYTKTSIFSFVECWNKFVRRLFSRFGKPANCLGHHHIDKLLECYEEIQLRLFSKFGDANGLYHIECPSPAGYLRELILLRYGIADVPDAYVFFPTELGGLGLISASTTLLLLRNIILDSPSTLLDKETDYKMVQK
ncbi:hypothetical protein PGQ11_001931 [Apiospora arundinis]|uniref:Uncharacterized protein n=1 Tax=Apiospora arundinis TaxID=335852 RepID=A0ABR2JI67_9PEZI